MLASGRLVGFIPTKDYDKARTFYEGKLGFEFVSLDQFALVVRAGDHKIRISKSTEFHSAARHDNRLGSRKHRCRRCLAPGSRRPHRKIPFRSGS